jgi:hypothetical protein
MKRNIVVPAVSIALGSVVFVHAVAHADADMLPPKASVNITAATSTSATLSLTGLGYVMVAETILDTEHQVGPTTDTRRPATFDAAPPLNTLGTQPFATPTTGETTSPLMMLPKPPKS